MRLPPDKIFFSQVFLGNTDTNLVKRNDFPIPVLASSVYILPVTANNNVGLRLEIYGCKGGKLPFDYFRS